MSEHDEQCAVIKWCDIKGPPYSDIYAIPNAGSRKIQYAVKMKKEGLKAGIPDLHLPVARKGYNSLYIEMKFGRNKATPAQLQRINILETHGNKCVVCNGFDEAKEVLTNYLG